MIKFFKWLFAPFLPKRKELDARYFCVCSKITGANGIDKWRKFPIERELDAYDYRNLLLHFYSQKGVSAEIYLYFGNKGLVTIINRIRIKP